MFRTQAVPRMFYSADNDGAGGSSPAPEAYPGDVGGSPAKPIMTEEELTAYKADLRRNLLADVRRQVREEEDAAAKKARQEREEAEAKARGDFEVVENQLRVDLASAEEEAQKLRETNQRFTDVVNRMLEDQWNPLPEEIREMYTGADDDVLAKLDFLPRARRLVERFTSSSETPPPLRGNGPDVPPAGRHPATRTVEEEIAALGQRHNYRM